MVEFLECDERLHCACRLPGRQLAALGHHRDSTPYRYPGTPT
ncbi:hypothetical protein [Pseudomonas aeruginosa]|nr:hypothetical protein [Pseudomonas aeruginosa]